MPLILDPTSKKSIPSIKKLQAHPIFLPILPKPLIKIPTLPMKNTKSISFTRYPLPLVPIPTNIHIEAQTPSMPIAHLPLVGFSIRESFPESESKFHLMKGNFPIVHSLHKHFFLL